MASTIKFFTEVLNYLIVDRLSSAGNRLDMLDLPLASAGKPGWTQIVVSAASEGKNVQICYK